MVMTAVVATMIMVVMVVAKSQVVVKSLCSHKVSNVFRLSIPPPKNLLFPLV
jgi:hypothetical protein